MYIRVSKTLTNYLNKEIKNAGLRFEYREIKPELYNVYINCDPSWIDIELDYNAKTDKMKYITVVYPPEYYAMNDHISTSDLLRIFKRSDKTAAGFIESVKNEYMI